MKTLKAHSDLLIISFITTFWTTLVLGAFFYSSYFLIHYWDTILSPCLKCVSSFSNHFFTPHHLTPLLLFGLSLAGIIRGGLFLKKEFALQKLLNKGIRNQDGIHMFPDAPMTAYSIGLLSPQICISSEFWNSLTESEQKALHAHEQCHVSQRHALQLLLLGWIKAITPLPFINKYLSRFITSIRAKSEFQADAMAISATSRLTLASLLYKSLEFEINTPPRAVCGIDTNLDQRIKCLTQKQCPPKKNFTPYYLILLSSAVSSLSVIALFLNTLEPLAGCFAG